MTSSVSMFTKVLVATVFVVAAATSQAATQSSSHSSSGITTYRVTGTVQQVDTVNNRVTLAQNSVTELGWPVRTMSYQVNSNGVLQDITIGQKISATFTAESRYNPVLRTIAIDAR